jgi:hypothetical protein
MYRRRVLLLGVMALMAVVWPGGTPEVWTDGSVHGPWRAIFNGEGHNLASGDAIVLEPRPARSATETHAGLIVSRLSYTNIDYSSRIETLHQLRLNDEPNPWEVGWLIWNYTDRHHFYYIALKPNGWEVGKADPGYPGNQRFLATGPETFPVGYGHDVRIMHRGDSFRIWVDGRLLINFTDQERPYSAGSVGIYTEDAVVRYEQLTLGGEVSRAGVG